MKYKEGDKVVCVCMDREIERKGSNIKLNGIYTVQADFGIEDNPNITFNMLENIVIFKETGNFHNKKDFILLSEYRKQKISNLLDDL